MNENSWKFWGESAGISIKIQDNQIFTNNFHRAEKRKRHDEEICAFRQKMKKFVKFSRKCWDFWSKYLWRIVIFIIFCYIFLGFLPILWQYMPLEDSTIFYNNFSYFGKDRSGSSPHHSTLLSTMISQYQNHYIRFLSRRSKTIDAASGEHGQRPPPPKWEKLL